MPTMGEAFGGTLAAAGIIGALIVIGKSVVWLTHNVRRVGRLIDAVMGAPAGPGLPEGLPSLLEQFAEVKGELAAVKGELAAVTSQLTTNGGASLADAVKRIETGVADHLRTHASAISSDTAAPALADASR